MNWVIILVCVASAIALLVIAVKHLLTKQRVKQAFANGSVCVFGRKGFGKDILFQAVINWRKDDYFSNLNYGGKHHWFDPFDLKLGSNDYHNFIKGEIEIVDKNKQLEGKDIYISDAGIYLPSQYDSFLHKVYPSFPIAYALSRHLWNNGIHANAQRLNRIWKALREQADYFILLRKRCLKLPFFIVLFTTEYTKYESANEELNPMKNTLFNKYSKAEKELYKAKHGDIKNGLLIIPKRTLKYDSRAFHQIIYGEKAPRKDTLWNKIKLSQFFNRIRVALSSISKKSKGKK